MIGSNGAGKTTTLKTITGLIKPTSGRILFGDQSLSDMPVEKIVESGVVYVPEGRGIFPDMSVDENLQMGSFPKHARAQLSENLRNVFSLFPKLEARRKQLGGTLSGGEAQMLAIGRGMMSMPKILMLDEPSAGLSPIASENIFVAIEKLREKGITILIVEQDAGRALKLADTAYVVENGRITLEGKGSELFNNQYVRQAYLGM